MREIEKGKEEEKQETKKEDIAVQIDKCER
jgi:hypothetical protein